MTGVSVSADEDGHVYKSEDGEEALWFGGIDDLWKFGKPVGVGGPWKNTEVEAGEVSDPYLMTGYDKKRLRLEIDKKATLTLEVNFDHHNYHVYRTWTLNPNEPVEFEFPKGFSAHWVRLSSDRDCTATATFYYE